MIKKLIITACIEAIILVVAAMISTDFLRENAVWIALGAVLILVLIGSYDAIKNIGRGSVSPATQATAGNSAHNFQNVGTINIHPIPAAVQEPKSPYGSGVRILGGGPSRPNIYPDMTLVQVADRLLDRIGPVRSDTLAETLGRVDLKILDAVVNRPLHTWGRREAGRPVTPVWKEAWERGDFSTGKGELAYRSPDNPNAKIRWTDIQFCRAEVDLWLPPHWQSA